MATPLTAIGKYAGVLMAVMCVLLMFAFVIGDPLMQYAGGASAGRASGGGEVVASWDGGRINERQLEMAVMHRNVLAEFQREVIQRGARAASADGIDLEFAEFRVQPLNLPFSREQGVERDVVQRRIFAKKAAESGMVVSDEMIVDYLRGISFDRVSNDEMRSILSRMNTGGGRRATIAFVFDLLREAILANNYLASHAYLLQTILPEERWEDWRKVNERVVVEAAPLRVADFLDDAPEPSDAEVEALYELYRNREPSPEVLTGYGNVELPSPLPAFATPPTVKLVYLKADFNVTVEGLKDEITDEDIRAYYEENKESFIEADRALFGDDSPFDLEDLMGDDTAPAPGPAEEAPQSQPDTEPTQPAESDEPSTTEPAAPATEEAPAANEAPAVEEEEEEEESSASAEEPASSTAGESVGEEAATEGDTAYQPLEEVADEIRRRLATQRAAQALDEKMQRIKTRLDDAFFDYFDALTIAEESGETENLPAPSDELANLKPLAEQEALELVELDQATQMALRETTVGGSVNADPSARQALPVWLLAFRADDLDLYQPLTTYDIDGNRYMVLVTERTERQTPELEEIRDQVVRASRTQRAAELALEEAERLAKEATDSGATLLDFFEEREDSPIDPQAIEETDTFSLFSIGPLAPSARRVPLRLSQPEPLVAPGPDLMTRVFELEPGEIGAALNHDHSIAYVLRIAQRIGTQQELRENFLRDGDRWIGGAALMQARLRNKARALTFNLLEDAGLLWEQAPDTLP